MDVLWENKLKMYCPELEQTEKNLNFSQMENLNFHWGLIEMFHCDKFEMCFYFNGGEGINTLKLSVLKF